MRDMHVIAQKNREYVEKHNPCLEEEQLSRKCLEANNYEQEKCNRFFQNVKKCREFWDTVKLERRIKGIRPLLPLPNERAQIKAEYLKNSTYPE